MLGEVFTLPSFVTRAVDPFGNIAPSSPRHPALRLSAIRRFSQPALPELQCAGSMDGLKLAHYVRGRWPPVKIIVTSGHVKVTEESLPAGALFMPKPYDPAEITHKVREMIAA
jgi:two-component system, response regulator PdtaR